MNDNLEPYGYSIEEINQIVGMFGPLWEKGYTQNDINDKEEFSKGFTCPNCKKKWTSQLPHSDITVHDEYIVIWGELWCSECEMYFEINAKAKYIIKERGD